MMTVFSQRDPRWANNNIGASKLRIGTEGCTLTCVAMLSTAWNAANGTTPAAIASNADWFTPDGLILWGKLAIHGLKFDGRLRMFCQDAVKAAVKDENRAALIEVKLPSGWKHWVVAVRNELMTGWRIADPLTGTYRWLPREWTPVGCAFFSRI